jgi:hypothetical protein
MPLSLRLIVTRCKLLVRKNLGDHLTTKVPRDVPKGMRFVPAKQCIGISLPANHHNFSFGAEFQEHLRQNLTIQIGL